MCRVDFQIVQEAADGACVGCQGDVVTGHVGGHIAFSVDDAGCSRQGHVMVVGGDGACAQVALGFGQDDVAIGEDVDAAIAREVGVGRDVHACGAPVGHHIDVAARLEQANANQGVFGRVAGAEDAGRRLKGRAIDQVRRVLPAVQARAAAQEVGGVDTHIEAGGRIGHLGLHQGLLEQNVQGVLSIEDTQVEHKGIGGWVAVQATDAQGLIATAVGVQEGRASGALHHLHVKATEGEGAKGHGGQHADVGCRIDGGAVGANLARVGAQHAAQLVDDVGGANGVVDQAVEHDARRAHTARVGDVDDGGRVVVLDVKAICVDTREDGHLGHTGLVDRVDAVDPQVLGRQVDDLHRLPGVANDQAALRAGDRALRGVGVKHGLAGVAVVVDVVHPDARALVLGRQAAHGDDVAGGVDQQFRRGRRQQDHVAVVVDGTCVNIIAMHGTVGLVKRVEREATGTGAAIRVHVADEGFDTQVLAGKGRGVFRDDGRLGVDGGVGVGVRAAKQGAAIGIGIGIGANARVQGQRIEHIDTSGQRAGLRGDAGDGIESGVRRRIRVGVKGRGRRGIADGFDVGAVHQGLQQQVVLASNL